MGSCVASDLSGYGLEIPTKIDGGASKLCTIFGVEPGFWDGAKMGLFYANDFLSNRYSYFKFVDTPVHRGDFLKG